jgi:RNA polymerase sigma factor (sigma-70 family)
MAGVMRMDDWELLNAFRAEGSQAAFAELVRRHAGLVFGACRRQLHGNTHSAEDVTQAVFLVLARRPPVHRSGTSLAGWLYQTAHYACRNEVRAERSRQRHERSAAEERAVAMTPSNAMNSFDLDEKLDDAMGQLSSRDRDALLLRYYQDRDLRQVGDALGISQNTAAKRLSRALERLRRALIDRGVGVPTPALVTQALVRATRESATTGLDSKVSTAALGKTAASAASLHVAEGVIRMIRNAQIKVVSIATCAAVLLVGAVTVTAVLLTTRARAGATESAAAAPAAAPASAAPATNPAAAAAKLSPKEVLVAFADSVAAGDHERMRTLVYTDDASQSGLLDVACDFAAASAALRQGVAKAYGDGAARQLDGMLKQSPLGQFVDTIRATVKDAKVEIDTDGTHATIPTPYPNDLFHLTQDHGEWKIDASRMILHWSPEQRQQRQAYLHQLSEGIRMLGADLENGKYASMQEFAAAMQQQLMPGK